MSDTTMIGNGSGWYKGYVLSTGHNDFVLDPIFGLKVGGNCQLNAEQKVDANETLNALGFVRQNADGASVYVHKATGLRYELEYLPKNCRFVTRIS